MESGKPIIANVDFAEPEAFNGEAVLGGQAVVKPVRVTRNSYESPLLQLRGSSILVMKEYCVV